MHLTQRLQIRDVDRLCHYGKMETGGLIVLSQKKYSLLYSGDLSTTLIAYGDLFDRERSFVGVEIIGE